jgi:hypothetical protein
MAEMDVSYSRLTPNFLTKRLTLEFLSVDPNDLTSTGAVISGIGSVETYFPFSHIGDNMQHTEDKRLLEQTPVVIAPTPAAGETLIYCRVNLQCAWDASAIATTATIIVVDPRVAKVTGSF